MRVLLADLDDAPEEGVLVGRVGTIPLDDGIDLSVFGEIHAAPGRDRGMGRYGCRLSFSSATRIGLSRRNRSV